MVKGVHPDKEVRKAIKRLTKAGWTIKPSMGRSSHAWGRAHCPEGHGECVTSIWGTPVSPERHAARLVARIGACQRRSQSR